jgi:hypothetical protein
MTRRANPNADFEEFEDFLIGVLRSVNRRFKDVSFTQALVDMRTLCAEPIQNPVEFEHRGRKACFRVVLNKKRVVVQSGEDAQKFPYWSGAVEDVANAIVSFLDA